MRISDALTPVTATYPVDRPPLRVQSRGLRPASNAANAPKQGGEDSPRLPADRPVHGELLRRQASVARSGFIGAAQLIGNDGATDHLRSWRSPITRLADERAIHIYQTLEDTPDASAYPASFGVDLYV